MPKPALQAYRLHIHAKAVTSMHFQAYMGGALRSAFFDALWERFCMNKVISTCAECPLVRGCPISELVAPWRGEEARGKDVPRAYAFRPPVEQTRLLQPGDPFSFGLTLFGRSRELFPYVILALQGMSAEGIGRRVAANVWRRGTYAVEEVKAVQFLSKEEQCLLVAGNPQFAFPELAVTYQDAERFAADLCRDQVTLRLLTPLRLRSARQPVFDMLSLQPLIQRILERHDALARAYGGVPFTEEERAHFIAYAGRVRVDDKTRWVEVRTYSTRQQKSLLLSGLLGDVTYYGDVEPLLPVLVWGSVIQVGNSTTKGNGVYELVVP